MRNALCLYGKVGGTQGKDGLGERIDYVKCFESYKRHIIDVNQCDIFLHSWDIDIEDELLNLYRPLWCNFEKQIVFKDDESNRLYSRWYSTKESVKCKSNWEEVAKFKYDWVMLGRFDLLFFKDIIFSKLEPGYFHVAAWNIPPLFSKKDRVTGELNKPDRVNRSLYKDGLADLIFIGSSKMMDNFSTVYDYLDGNELSSHRIAWNQVKRVLGEPLEVCKFSFYRWFDFEIYRYKFCRMFN